MTFAQFANFRLLPKSSYRKTRLRIFFCLEWLWILESALTVTQLAALLCRPTECPPAASYLGTYFNRIPSETFVYDPFFQTKKRKEGGGVVYCIYIESFGFLESKN